MCFARRHRRSSTNDVIINDRDNKTQSIVVTSENRIPIASAVGAVSFVLFCATARFNFVRRFSTSRSPNASLSPPPLSPPLSPPLATQFRKRRLRRLRRRRRVPSSPRRQRNVSENVKEVVIEGEGQRNIVLFCHEKCGTISPLSTTHSAHKHTQNEKKTQNANLRENPCVKVVSVSVSLSLSFLSPLVLGFSIESSERDIIIVIIIIIIIIIIISRLETTPTTERRLFNNNKMRFCGTMMRIPREDDDSSTDTRDDSPCCCCCCYY